MFVLNKGKTQMNHYSRKERHLKRLIDKLNTLLKEERSFESQINRLIAKIKRLLNQLIGNLSLIKIKKIAGAFLFLVGINSSIEMNAQHFAYPTTDPFGINSGYVEYVQSVNLVDIDNDGDLDLFTDSLTYSYGPSGYIISKNFNYQENIGTATSPNFKAPQLNPFNLSLYPFDTSLIEYRRFVDLDGDGDLDILSNVIYGGYYSFQSKYRYYENTGSSNTANFASPTTNPFGLQTSSSVDFSTIGDIDNDGDFDLINTSLATGSIVNFTFVQNVGSNTNPIFNPPVYNTFGLPAISGLVIPSLVDLDGDGDLDMIYGEYSPYTGGGALTYRENIGTANLAQFALHTTNPYGLTATLFDDAPVLEFKDLDNDNDLDLLAGAGEEHLFYFENVLTQQPVTYDCINYNCVDPGTGNGPYTTLSACQTSCVAPITYDCDWNGNCDTAYGTYGQYISLADCQMNCTPPVTYNCDGQGNCYDPGTGQGLFWSYSNCIQSCQNPTYNCVGPGDCEDPLDGSGAFFSYNDCITFCSVAPETYDCVNDVCVDPGTGQGLYTSLAGCLANCEINTSTTSINSKIRIYPNPTENVLNIETEETIFNTEITDVQGRIVFENKGDINTIDTKKISKGMYTLKIVFEKNRVLMQKIIKE